MALLFVVAPFGTIFPSEFYTASLTTLFNTDFAALSASLFANIAILSAFGLFFEPQGLPTFLPAFTDSDTGADTKLLYFLFSSFDNSCCIFVYSPFA